MDENFVPGFGTGKNDKSLQQFFKRRNVNFFNIPNICNSSLGVIIGLLYVCILGQGSAPVASCQNISKFGQTDSCHTHVYYICRVTSATLEFVPTDQRQVLNYVVKF